MRKYLYRVDVNYADPASDRPSTTHHLYVFAEPSFPLRELVAKHRKLLDFVRSGFVPPDESFLCVAMVYGSGFHVAGSDHWEEPTRCIELVSDVPSVLDDFIERVKPLFPGNWAELDNEGGSRVPKP